MLEMNWKFYKVISGGQIGAEQGGLIGAFREGIETGGTAPTLYKTQDGYNPMLELAGLVHDGTLAERTTANVRDADGTLIIAYNVQSPGTQRTIRECLIAKSPYLILDVGDIVNTTMTMDSVGPHDQRLIGWRQKILRGLVDHSSAAADFVIKHQIGILNVAGNREIRGNGTPLTTMLITSIASQIIEHMINMLPGDNVVRK